MTAAVAGAAPAGPATAARENGGRWLIAALLAAALLVRLALIGGGGQYFWPDESRYDAARDALITMHNGQVWAGLSALIGQGDHVGFKLLGLVPAEIQRVTGVGDPRLAAAFFGFFSWMCLVLLWLWARRLGASLAAQVWTLLLAVTCTSLTFYCRHLFPYDPALALALAALWVGAKQDASPLRLLAAGALTGCAVLVYFGYWLLGGVVLVLLALHNADGWLRRLGRGALAGTGFAAVLAGIWLLDHWGQGTMVANAQRFSGTVTQGDFGQGYWLVWKYFWSTEGLVILLWIAATVLGIRRIWREACAGGRPAGPWLLGIAAILMIYGGLVLTSDVIHKFVVYGRSARQLAPFFCLAGGLALAEWLPPSRRRAAWLVAAVLVLNAGWHLEPALTQMFPLEFKRLAAARLKSAPPAEPGRSYYRLVNVDHYLFEPEMLPYPEEKTLLTRRHPYEYAPYLYEGLSAAQRVRRRTADQRMRLVLVRQPDALLVKGEPHGMVTMRIRFAPDRGGMAEPLLSLGHKGEGQLFFVRFLSGRDLVLGLESPDIPVNTSAPLSYEPGREYTLELFSGAMLPPAPDHPDPRQEVERLYYGNLAAIRWDGNEVLNELAKPPTIPPGELYAGFNYMQSTSADTAFSGTIESVRRGGLPPLPTGGLGNADCGAVRLVAWPPAAAAEVPEPLLVVGVPGKATLGYIRVLPGGRIKLGAEFWGYGAYESEAADAPSDAPAEIIFEFPALYPPVGDPRWGGIPRAEQLLRRTRLSIRLNGHVVLDKEVPGTGAPSAPVAFGRNPVGGSWVTSAFTGRLVQGMRLPLTESAGP